MKSSTSIFFASIIAGTKAGKRSIRAPATEETFLLSRKLYNAGYINSFSLDVYSSVPKLIIFLRYLPSGQPVLINFRLLTKSSKPTYINKQNLDRFQRTKRIKYLIKTTKGYFWSTELHNYNIGGELICSV